MATTGIMVTATMDATSVSMDIVKMESIVEKTNLNVKTYYIKAGTRIAFCVKHSSGKTTWGTSSVPTNVIFGKNELEAVDQEFRYVFKRGDETFWVDCLDIGVMS